MVASSNDIRTNSDTSECVTDLFSFVDVGWTIM